MELCHHLESIYAARSRQTLTQWQGANASSVCTATKSFYPEHLYALTSGIRPALNPAIIALLHELGALTAGDPRADIMHPDNFHVTFLPVTPAQYQRREAMPSTLILEKAFNQSVKHRHLQVDMLRLVALPDQLLLAGVPDELAVTERALFWETLMSGEWREPLQERHAGKSSPPVFWHTTLLRYHAATLPSSLRTFFIANQHQCYGSVQGTIRLAATTYNWSDVNFLTD